jgi:hypothetical protein
VKKILVAFCWFKPCSRAIGGGYYSKTMVFFKKKGSYRAFFLTHSRFSAIFKDAEEGLGGG